LAQIRQTWLSSVYAFYKGDVTIEYWNEKKHHVFTCVACGCKHTVTRYLTTNHNSTKSLHQHAVKCFGKETVNAALKTKNLSEATGLVKKHAKSKLGTLTAVFQKLASRGKEVYSHIPLTKAESRYVLIDIALKCVLTFCD
ncbi:hypothetical protein BT96DRAFT_820225, partial [Gymnopus androsaceus JB14]